MANKFSEPRDGQYYVDGTGRRLHQGMVHKVDKQRSRVVTKVCNRMDKLSKQVKAAKTEVFEMIFAFLNEPDTPDATTKGNITLLSYDDKLKIKLKGTTIWEINENANKAKAIIRNLVTKWQTGSNPALGALAAIAAKVASNERITYGDYAEYSKLNISDPDWKKAMDLLQHAFEPSDTKRHIYAWYRDSIQSDWQEIVVSWSKA